MSGERFDLIITGGEVIDPRIGPLNDAAVFVADGKIVAVETDKKKIAAALKEAAPETVIDASGKLVSPGLIDIHVHLREPGREDEETVRSGAAAAAAGGFTTVCCMPNTSPAIDDQETVRFVLSEAADAECRVCVVGAVTKGRKGVELSEIGDLVKAGVVAISDDGDYVQNPDLMRRALEYARMFDIPIMQHAEDSFLVGDGVMNESFTSALLGIKGRPAVAEEIAVLRDIELAKFTGGRVHIQHVSAAGSVAAIRRAKDEGVRITAEACPHHFTLTDDLIAKSFDTNPRVNPPIRTRADVEAIIAGLVDGTIDCIASDHAPHSSEEKDVEFDQAPAGMVGLETTLGLVKTQLIDKGYLSWTDALRLLTVNPARIINRPYGDLAVGSAADLTIIDPDREWVVDSRRFKSRSRNTPFDGWTLSGRAAVTIYRGRITHREGV
ncbi:MAG TPA: dihydroorotase [candidate division Zixibacteria bacterium]|nr:dihydroorotase [candidate division Zixibacteria bacterium]